VTKKKEEHLLQ